MIDDQAEQRDHADEADADLVLDGLYGGEPRVVDARFKQRRPFLGKRAERRGHAFTAAIDRIVDCREGFDGRALLDHLLEVDGNRRLDLLEVAVERVEHRGLADLHGKRPGGNDPLLQRLQGFCDGFQPCRLDGLFLAVDDAVHGDEHEIDIGKTHGLDVFDMILDGDGGAGRRLDRRAAVPAGRQHRAEAEECGGAERRETGIDGKGPALDCICVRHDAVRPTKPGLRRGIACGSWVKYASRRLPRSADIMPDEPIPALVRIGTVTKED